MSNTELFIIVDVALLEDDLDNGYHIPFGSLPSFVHTSRQSACDALLRLSHAEPLGKCVLFDAILFSRRKSTSLVDPMQKFGKVYEIAPIEELVL